MKHSAKKHVADSAVLDENETRIMQYLASSGVREVGATDKILRQRTLVQKPLPKEGDKKSSRRIFVQRPAEKEHEETHHLKLKAEQSLMEKLWDRDLVSRITSKEQFGVSDQRWVITALGLATLEDKGLTIIDDEAKMQYGKAFAEMAHHEKKDKYAHNGDDAQIEVIRTFGHTRKSVELLRRLHTQASKSK